MTTPERQEQRQRDVRPARDPEEENQVLDVLENTLWNRQLGVMSEEIVAALVCQIFEGVPSRPRPAGCLPASASAHLSLFEQTA